jgi:hypothetical protein
MASDLELLFSLKASNTQAKATIADTQADIRRLKTTYAAEVNEMATAAAVADRRIDASNREITADIIIRRRARTAAEQEEITRATNAELQAQALKAGAYQKVTVQAIAAQKALTKEEEKEAKRRADVADAEYAREVKAAETTAAKIAAIRKEMTRIIEAENLKQQRFVGNVGIRGVAGGTGAGTLAVNAANLGRSAEQAEVKLAALEAEAVALDSAFVSTAGSIGATGTALSGLVGPLGIAAIAIGAVTLGLVGLGAVVFKAAKEAADFGNQIFDLQQKTLLSAATLTTFKVAAEQAGSTIERAGAFLTKWSGSLADARDEHSKTAKVLTQFGIDAKTAYQDPDRALKQFIDRFNTLPPTTARNKAEMLLFKDRTGELLPILDQIGGSFERFQDRAKQLGLVLSDEDTKAADAFGDKLTELGQVAGALSRQFGQQLLPEMTQFFDVIEGFLAQNQANFKRWGEDAAIAIRGVSGLLEAIRLNQAGVPFLTAIRTAKAEQAAIDAQTAALSDTRTSGTPGRTGQEIQTNFGKTGADKAKAAAAREYATALKEAADAEKQVQTTQEANARRNKEDLEQQNIDIKEYTENALKYNEALYQAETDRTRAEYIAANIALKKKVLDFEQYSEKVTDIDVRNKAAEEKRNAEAQKLEDDRDRKLNEADKRQRERIYKSQVDADKRALEEVRFFEDQSFITHEEAETRREAVAQDAYLRDKQRLNDAINDVKTDVEERKDLQQELLDLEAHHRQTAVDNERAITEAKAADNDETQRAIDLNQELTDAEIARQRREQIERDLRDPTSSRSLFGDVFADDRASGVGPLKAFADTAGDILHQLSSEAGNFGTIMKNVFSGVAQAVGNTVRSFVLLGTAGTSFRKFAAEVIAGVAEMAAVKAIFELAEGFANLAKALLGSPTAGAAAVLNFKAAAQYGIVAGVAAIAGRAIAGNSFKDQGGAGGTSGGGFGGSGGTSGNSNQTTTITQNRNQAPEPIVIHLHSHTDGGMIIDKVIADVGNNGRMREVIVKTANS